MKTGSKEFHKACADNNVEEMLKHVDTFDFSNDGEVEALVISVTTVDSWAVMGALIPYIHQHTNNPDVKNATQKILYK
jgi:hypothetical protein